MFKVITPATTYPVSLTETKLHLKVDAADEDTLITSLIQVATAQCENYTWLTLMQTVFEKVDDDFDACIKIDTYPVSSIDSVKYYDIANVLQTLAATDYESDLINAPAMIKMKYGNIKPDTYPRFDAVTVRFTAGYASASAVPVAIKQGMLMLIGHLYANREDFITGTIVSNIPYASQKLWEQYRVNRFV
jgi:uncharacterized phiE125 gp8 family phage protein